ncbi:hypothetical protein [Lacipirellula sp.]|uniref:hypothetical protein n=1 Tax=Lacipirellula sp. TaxID=2691419 RepID=UPI003D0D978C
MTGHGFGWLWAVLVMATQVSYAAETPFELPADAKILDPDVIIYGGPRPVISPDGEWVAYVSRGFVCVSSVDGGKPTRLFEVPESWTHFLALPENEFAEGDFGTLARSLSQDEYRQMLKQIKQELSGLQWTIESDGVVFGVLSHDPAKQLSRSVYLAPLTGDVIRISHSEQSTPTQARGVGGDFKMTRDRRYMVMSLQWGKALIWEVERDRPRATCFLNMTPSSTSDRWIAVEKDTRELVILDREFSVIRRFDEVIEPNQFGYKMYWSPDERNVICQTQVGFDHFSNWEGFRLDLQTMERRPMSGSFMNELIEFTGQGGEFVRVGSAGDMQGREGIQPTTSYLKVVPTGPGATKDLWQIRADSTNPRNGPRLTYEPQMTHSPDFSLFTLGLPRQGVGPHGVVQHLLDRQGRLWTLSPHDLGGYRTPCDVVGFAKKGQMIIGYDQHRLFAIPVGSIQTPANKVPNVVE